MIAFLELVALTFTYNRFHINASIRKTGKITMDISFLITGRLTILILVI